jgi:D-alanyl-D-alanine carboxypeptidase
MRVLLVPVFLLSVSVHAAPASGDNLAIAAEIAKFAESKAFSGVVLLAKDGRPFLHRAFGPNTTLDTKFNLASVNKLWTMAAIAQLAGEGKLAYDDKVGKHLPRYPNRDVREKVTIEQLLTHRSGLGEFLTAEYMKTQPVKLRDLLPFFAHDTLEFEPGTTRGYSNAGFVVLGLIIEKVTGRDYFDYIGDTILKPLGMTSTSFAGTPHNEFIPRHGSPAGGAWTTAADMLKFAEWLRRREPPRGIPRDGDLMGHSGGIEGVSADVYMYPKLGYTVIVLSHQDAPASHDVARLARRLIESKGNAAGPR